MTEPTACCAARCCSPIAYCDNCDLLVGLDGLHVLDVVDAEEHLRVRVRGSAKSVSRGEDEVDGPARVSSLMS